MVQLSCAGLCPVLPCSAHQLIAINQGAVRVSPLDMAGLAAVDGADPADVF